MIKRLLLAVLLVALLWPLSAKAAFDAASKSNGGSWSTNVSSFSWSHTTSGSNRFLAVAVSTFNSASRTVTGITYNGVALTKLDGITAAQESNNQDFEVWYLVNPASGSNTIAVTLSGTTSFTMGVATSHNAITQTGTIDSHAISQITTATDNENLSTTVVSSQASLLSFAWSRVSPATGPSTNSTTAPTFTRITTNDSLIAGDSGGNVGTGSKSQGYFKSGATYWPGIATFSILTDNAEAAPAAVPKINSFGIVENADDRVSKLNSYGIVEATGEGVSKINSYAIVQGASGVSKMNGYAVVTALPASGPASVFFQPFTHP